VRRVGWGRTVVVIAVLLASPVVPSDATQSDGVGRLVLEDFTRSDGDGFPVNWENESARSGSRAREAYRVSSEGPGFLAVRGADQRIKKKKIDWDPKAYPMLTWRWRLQKAPEGSEPIAVLYVSLDTDLLFIPVFTKYVWSGTKPEGTMSEGGMFSGTEIVVQTGRQPVGHWIDERVNVYEDFKRVHGHDPATKAWGISILGGPGVEIDIGPLVAASSPGAAQAPRAPSVQ
jgi:Protein of unknown function (DUF3047)